MKTLYLDCGMGAAGDMLTAALMELLPDPAAFVEELNALGLPGVETRLEKAVKCGITGSHICVLVNGEEEESHDHHEHDEEHHHHDHEQEHHHHHGHEHPQNEEHLEQEHHHPHDLDDDHEHHHDHDHGHHGHSHRGMHGVEHIVLDHMNLPEAVREDVLAVYRLIAGAEAKAHDMPVEEVHFHEVGTMDAIADVAAVCLLMHRLAPDEVVASPVHVGSGKVRCAHGILPVPAPATAALLEGIPCYGGEIQGELCTPTGAALLRHFVTRFGPMPAMVIEKIGYGMGKKDFPIANCLRAIWGTDASSTQAAGQDRVLELSCNLDDMSGEEIGFVEELLLQAGAREVYTLAAGMKKSRPGVVLTVLCDESQRDALVALLFAHTSTIGVREAAFTRHVLTRTEETAQTSFGPVRFKRSQGFGVIREKWEYEDLAAIARQKGMSLRQVREQLEKEKKESNA